MAFTAADFPIPALVAPAVVEFALPVGLELLGSLVRSAVPAVVPVELRTEHTREHLPQLSLVHLHRRVPRKYRGPHVWAGEVLAV